MSERRILTVAAAQLGPIARDDTRAMVVERLIGLLRGAARRGARLVVFPELALTTFFPRWAFASQEEIDMFFEEDMPNADTAPLFAEARRLGVGFHLGFAEKTRQGGRIRRFNTAILIDERGSEVGRYRKVHLPGHASPEPWRPFQHLEKAYFEPGEDGFPVWDAFGGRAGICICNDRRWPESYRVMALQGVELIMIGYNTPLHYPPAPEHDHLQAFHNHLVMQAGAYQNGSWIVAAAKAGVEEGCAMLGQSCVIAPTGEIVAQAGTLGDEIVLSEIDLDRCREIKSNIFSFEKHRRPGQYRGLSEP